MIRSLVVGVIALILGAGLGVSFQGPASRLFSPGATDSARALAGIRALHRADSIATVPGDPDSLAMLFTPNGVRMEPGGAAVVGRETMRAEDLRFRATHPGSGITKYVSHIVATELHGDWAVEWGYFDSEYVTGTGAPPQSVRGKVLRVLHREPDGRWRFSHVAWNATD